MKVSLAACPKPTRIEAKTKPLTELHSANVLKFEEQKQ